MGANETEEGTRGSPQVNIRVPEQLLEEVDEVYEKRGYSNRSEFIRNAIRDAVNPPIRLCDEALEEIEKSKEELRKGEYVCADEL